MQPDPDKALHNDFPVLKMPGGSRKSKGSSRLQIVCKVPPK
jgi:hypothetical protein